MEIESGEMNQTEVTPVVGAGVGEYKSTDPFQAEPLPGDQDGTGGDDTTTGWINFLNGGPISWRTKRQDIVAASSTEAELYALADCVKQVRWLSMFLGELGFPQPAKTPGRGGKIAEPNFF